MKILVTGAKGFVGKNLCASLKNIQDSKDRRFPDLKIEAIFEYDLGNTSEELDAWCRECDFVFNLAGVNRPQNQEEFMEGNFGFASTLLDTLKKHGNRCPVMLSSSQQASLTGRFGNSEYGRSKKAGEELFLDYERNFLSTDCTYLADIKDTCNTRDTRSPLSPRVLIYRFPNLFGKWCRPNYNSAVATFCHNIAHELPIHVNDPSVQMHLVYIDDVVDELIASLTGDEHHAAPFCEVPVSHHISLGGIVDLLHSFHDMPQTLEVPNLEDAFAKKLYSTYLSYLPEDKTVYSLKMNEDERGSFTEIIRTPDRGQVSVNISKPGITKGQHWHHTKNEKFVVVSGHGLIQLRREGTDEQGNPYPVREYEVSGSKIQVVEMLPGYTHNIINLSDTDDLVTVMWANEAFNPNRPDTYFDPVK